MTHRPRVAIVFGGTSHEHGISCLTAASVTRAIDPAKYEVVGVGITPAGEWVMMPGADVAALRVSGRRMPEVVARSTDAVLAQEERTNGGDGAGSGDPERDHTALAGKQPGQTAAAVHLPDLAGIDVAFSMLHGPFGEDGTIQGLFEMLGVRYVGSGVFASAAGMDKHYMKMLMAGAAVPVGPYVAITAREWARDPDAAMDAVAALHYPVFVKPARAGSSFGINRVASAAHLAQAIEFAHQYDPKVIVEQGFVGARELECGVLEGANGPQASVVAEIRTSTESGFYDFEAKYLPGEDVQADVPADIPDEITQQVRSLSVKVFEALGCEGLARVDFFLTPQGDLYCNEINTMPGFTAQSMYPRLWAESGVDYPALIDTLVQQGLNRPLGLR